MREGERTDGVSDGIGKAGALATIERRSGCRRGAAGVGAGGWWLARHPSWGVSYAALLLEAGELLPRQS